MLPFHDTNNGGFGFCCDDKLDDRYKKAKAGDGSGEKDLDWLVSLKLETEQDGANIKMRVTSKDPVIGELYKADKTLAFPKNSITHKLTFPNNLKDGAYVTPDGNTAEIKFMETTHCTSSGSNKQEITKSLRDLEPYMSCYAYDSD